MITCNNFLKGSPHPPRDTEPTDRMNVQDVPLTSETNFDTSNELNSEVMKQSLFAMCENYSCNCNSGLQ